MAISLAEARSRFQVRFVGLDETVAHIRALGDAPTAVRQLAKALFTRGSKILQVSQRLVPVDTGALRGSGHVTFPEVDGKSASVKIVYGGAAAPYAYEVHENLQAYHRVGQAKYLETAALAERGGTLKDLATAIREFTAAKRAGRRLAA